MAEHDVRRSTRALARRRWLAGGAAAVMTLAGVAGWSMHVGASVGTEGSFNQPGNVLIADQFNNRVVELDAENDIVWQFGVGPNDTSAHSVLGVNDAQRVKNDTLMAGTGVPANDPAFEPNCASGCADNRVLLVDQSGAIVWQYGQFGVTGSGPDQLNTPVQNTYLPNGDILITDQGNQRVIEVNKAKNIVWQYGTTGVAGSGPNQLSNPNSAELLPSGNVLIADENNNRAIVVNHNHQIVTSFQGTFAGKPLNGVAFASRLPNGNTLLTDANNNRVLEVTSGGSVVWSFTTNADTGSNANPLPTRAIRLRNGDTLISDQFNDRVIEVDHGSPAQLVRQWGTTNVAGVGRNAFNAPYDAKVIGDFTGLTAP